MQDTHVFLGGNTASTEGKKTQKANQALAHGTAPKPVQFHGKQKDIVHPFQRSKNHSEGYTWRIHNEWMILLYIYVQKQYSSS